MWFPILKLQHIPPHLTKDTPPTPLHHHQYTITTNHNHSPLSLSEPHDTAQWNSTFIHASSFSTFKNLYIILIKGNTFVFIWIFLEFDIYGGIANNKILIKVFCSSLLLYLILKKNNLLTTLIITLQQHIFKDIIIIMKIKFYIYKKRIRSKIIII